MNKIYDFLRWPWAQWTDVCTFSYGSTSYLVQGRTHVISNRRQFRCTKCDGSRWWQDAHTPTVDQQVLQRAGMFQQPMDAVS